MIAKRDIGNHRLGYRINHRGEIDLEAHNLPTFVTQFKNRKVTTCVQCGSPLPRKYVMWICPDCRKVSGRA